MKKFTLRLVPIEAFEIEVEAENEDDAYEKAGIMFSCDIEPEWDTVSVEDV
jgi:hypothetical protein